MSQSANDEYLIFQQRSAMEVRWREYVRRVAKYCNRAIRPDDNYIVVYVEVRFIVIFVFPSDVNDCSIGEFRFRLSEATKTPAR